MCVSVLVFLFIYTHRDTCLRACTSMCVLAHVITSWLGFFFLLFFQSFLDYTSFLFFFSLCPSFIFSCVRCLSSRLQQALQMAAPTIKCNADNLPAELSGRLLHYYTTHPNIRSLINQCDTCGLKQCCLLPNFAYQQVGVARQEAILPLTGP